MPSQLEQAQEALKRAASTREARAIIEFHAKKHKESNYVQYWRPTDAQVDRIKEFDQETKIFALLGGNRSGKTELGAFIATVWLLGKQYFIDSPAWEFVKDLPVPEPPNNIWVVGLDFPTLRDVIWREKLRHGRNHPGLLPKEDSIIKKVSDSEYQVFAQNGSIITGKSADSGREKFQGASVDLVWIDEEPEADVFEECYQRTIDCRGKILLTLTPLTDIASGVRVPWVFNLHEDWKNGKADVKFVSLSVMDNPYVPDEEKVKLLAQWAGHPEERARLYGEFVRRSGLVYPMWKPALHMISPFPIPKEWSRIVSIDPANTGMTAAIWGAFSETGDMYLTDEYYEKEKIVSGHAKDILLRNKGQIVDIWLIDPKWATQRQGSDHKQNYMLYREAGLPVRPAEIDDTYGLNVSLEYLNATITAGSRHPKCFVFDTCKHFKKEIEGYTWDSFSKGGQKGLSKEKPRKRDDHLMNAWQYLCAGKFKGKRTAAMSSEDRKKFASINSYT